MNTSTYSQTVSGERAGHDESRKGKKVSSLETAFGLVLAVAAGSVLWYVTSFLLAVLR